MDGASLALDLELLDQRRRVHERLRAERDGLTEPGFWVLTALGDQLPLTNKSLCEKTGYRHSTVCAAGDQLIDRGLVVEVAAVDERLTQWHITPSGLKSLRRCHEALALYSARARHEVRDALLRAGGRASPSELRTATGYLANTVDKAIAQLKQRKEVVVRHRGPARPAQVVLTHVGRPATVADHDERSRRAA